MNTNISIEFDQLLKLVKALPSDQLEKLKYEIEKETGKTYGKSKLEELLLNGPVATEKQLETIENNRNAINKWRMN